MKIIYLGSHGCYSALAAAAIHLGLYSKERGLVKSLLALDFFCSDKNSIKPGFSKKIGKDKNDNELFVVGVAGETQLIKKSSHDFLRINGLDPESILLVDASISNFFESILKIFVWLNIERVATIFAVYYLRYYQKKLFSIVDEVINRLE